MKGPVAEKLAIVGIIVSPLLLIPAISWWTSDHRTKSDEEVAGLALKYGDANGALLLFSSLILKRPYDPWLKYDRAKAHLMLGHNQEALIDLNQAIGLAPDQKEISDVYKDRGELFLKLGKYKQAADDFTKAMDLNPLIVGRRTLRARAFLGLKDYSRAVNDCTQVIMGEKIGVTDLNVGEAYHDRAQADRALGRRDQAKRDEEMAAKNGFVD